MSEQKTTRVYMVRHGATQLSAEDRFAGAVDVHLSDEGKFQAAQLAERLADDSIAAVYCSPMTRTIQTATIVASPHDVPIIHRDGLREIHHGHWEGMRRADVESQFPDEYAAWEEDPFTFAPQGGEAGVNVIARACLSSARLFWSIADRTCWSCRTKPHCACSSAVCSALMRAATVTALTNLPRA
jgi:probable phosphoglycerate mutase